MSQTSSFRVFVVDDEAVIAMTLTRILQNSGYAAEYFTDSTAALAKIRDEQPDLLLSDVMMPRLSGIELAIAVKEASPASEILLFSGQTATVDLMKAAREQGHCFTLMHKPVHPTELLAHIATIARPEPLT